MRPSEMTIIGAAFLLAIGRALTRIHVKNDHPLRSPPVHLADPLTGKIGERGKVLGHFVSKRPIWLAEAAAPVTARSPTTQRIAGSRHSRSASFTSS